jgi:hypothetical protein
MFIVFFFCQDNLIYQAKLKGNNEHDENTYQHILIFLD